MVLLTFPKPSKRKRARRPAGPAARVHPFPSARHYQMVPNVCALMRGAVDQSTPFMSTAGINAAEAVLIRHLEVVWDRLEKFGVTEEEREIEVQAFAVAAWSAYQRALIFDCSSDDVA